MQWHSANCSTDEQSEPVGPELNGFILEESPDSTLFFKAEVSEENIHVTCVKQKTKIHSCFINSPKKATVLTRLCDVIMSALESYLESSGTALLQRVCDMELLINTR